MPARKPISLHRQHLTASEKATRVAREKAVVPERKLQMAVPASLAGHAIASATWRNLRREFESLESPLVSRLDEGLLVDLCILVEQLVELDELRKEAHESKNIDDLVKLDARADRKRNLLLALRQSLYLTPRARSGASFDYQETPNVQKQKEAGVSWDEFLQKLAIGDNDDKKADYGS